MRCAVLCCAVLYRLVLVLLVRVDCPSGREDCERADGEEENSLSADSDGNIEERSFMVRREKEEGGGGAVHNVCAFRYQMAWDESGHKFAMA
eukprot:757886-Hanusia_phi.AAC.2